MPIELNISDYRAWMTSNIMLSDPFAPDSLKRLVIALIMGKNYRLLTEENTKKKLTDCSLMRLTVGPLCPGHVYWLKLWGRRKIERWWTVKK